MKNKKTKLTHIHIGGNVEVRILNEKNYLLIVFHQTDPIETRTNNQSENLNCMIDYMYLNPL